MHERKAALKKQLFQEELQAFISEHQTVESLPSQEFVREVSEDRINAVLNNKKLQAEYGLWIIIMFIYKCLFWSLLLQLETFLYYFVSIDLFLYRA